MPPIKLRPETLGGELAVSPEDFFRHVNENMLKLARTIAHHQAINVIVARVRSIISLRDRFSYDPKAIAAITEVEIELRLRAYEFWDLADQIKGAVRELEPMLGQKQVGHRDATASQPSG